TLATSVTVGVGTSRPGSLPGAVLGTVGEAGTAGVVFAVGVPGVGVGVGAGAAGGGGSSARAGSANAASASDIAPTVIVQRPRRRAATATRGTIAPPPGAHGRRRRTATISAIETSSPHSRLSVPEALQPVSELVTVASGGAHHWLSMVQAG